MFMLELKSHELYVLENYSKTVPDIVIVFISKDILTLVYTFFRTVIEISMMF